MCRRYSVIMANDRKSRYQHVDIHLCKHCGEEFELADEVVCLSDGMVRFENIYNVENRRFYHVPCWEAEVGER